MSIEGAGCDRGISSRLLILRSGPECGFACLGAPDGGVCGRPGCVYTKQLTLSKNWLAGDNQLGEKCN